ncbi:HD domain-containing protein [Nostoc sp. FACHB-152]|nr:HD domain-containing protein [Nostoc sp. FACHB-152]MBD2466796.1 HD domain-containing protein [Nostoc sp. FACHB-145]
MQTKAALPIRLLAGKDTLLIIQAYFEFNHLKQLYRQGWLQHGIEPQYCESVAEHSFSVALLALLLAETHSLDVNKTKVIQMALIHDLGEVYAGDFTPSDGVNRQQKYQLEKNSITQILDKLPNGSYWIDLWEEYEQGTSSEAQFVRQIDQLEMVLQASVYEHQGLANLSEFFQSTSHAFKAPDLNSIFQMLERLRNDEQAKLDKKTSQLLLCYDCAFHVNVADTIECIHPDEVEVNCATVTFCNSFQPSVEIDSPCVTFGQDEE